MVQPGQTIAFFTIVDPGVRDWGEVRWDITSATYDPANPPLPRPVVTGLEVSNQNVKRDRNNTQAYGDVTNRSGKVLKEGRALAAFYDGNKLLDVRVIPLKRGQPIDVDEVVRFDFLYLNSDFDRYDLFIAGVEQ